MPNYVHKTLHEFQQPPPLHRVYAPSKYKAPIYGAKIRYAQKEDASKILPTDKIMHVQHVVSKLLYYALAIYNTILVTLSDLGSEQAKSKETTMQTFNHRFNYMATNPDATIGLNKGVMLLRIQSHSLQPRRQILLHVK